MTEFKYRVDSDPHTGEKRAQVDQVGFIPLNDNEGDDKVKRAVAMALNLDEKDVEVKRVKDLDADGPITSDQVGNRNNVQVDDLHNEKASKKNK
jgi:hypothetical protein